MNEELDLLKYLRTNFLLNQEWLCKIIKTKEIHDEVYEFVRDEIAESRKYIKAIEHMIESRNKKIDKEANVIYDMVTSFGAKIADVKTNKEYINLLKESIKINIMDINRVRNEYNIKSKTILNLLSRIESSEKNNLLKLDII